MAAHRTAGYEIGGGRRRDNFQHFFRLTRELKDVEQRVNLCSSLIERRAPAPRLGAPSFRSKKMYKYIQLD